MARVFSVSEPCGGLGPWLLKEALWCGGKGIDFGIGRRITQNYHFLYEGPHQDDLTSPELQFPYRWNENTSSLRVCQRPDTQ